MVKDRKGFDREEFSKEVRENKELMDFIKSLTKEEIQRIKEVREFEAIEKDTPTYNIAVLCDSLRQQMRKLKLMIEKRIWSIDDLTNNMNRLKVQLATGNITEVMKNNVPMNEAELKSLIKHNEWLRDGEFFDLFKLFAETRSLVGHKDVAGNVILSMKDFDKWVLDTKEHIKKYGYELFGEINE